MINNNESCVCNNEVSDGKQNTDEFRKPNHFTVMPSDVNSVRSHANKLFNDVHIQPLLCRQSADQGSQQANIYKEIKKSITL